MSELFEETAVEQRTDRRAERAGGCLRLIVVILIALAVLAAAGWFVAGRLGAAISAPDYPAGQAGEPVTVEIPEGTTLTDMGTILTDSGVVESQRAFVRASRANDRAGAIQAGTYQLPTHIPAAEAVEALLDPASKSTLTVSVREGLPLGEQLDAMAEQTGIPREEFAALAENPEPLGLPAYANGVEGYLFPDTYSFEAGAGAQEIMTTMVEQFTTVASEVGLEKAAQAQGYQPGELVTIASIVEGEVFNEGDRAKVARVIYNRLDDGMPLQMDSTVKYVHGIDGKVTTSDQERASDNPYNTYVHTGLPPGPIGAPGRAALEAAAHPDDGPWLYFVAVDLETGETKFAETFEEHSRNVAQFQQWCQANADRGMC